MATTINDTRKKETTKHNKTYYAGQWFVDADGNLWTIVHTDPQTISLNRYRNEPSIVYMSWLTVEDSWEITQEEMDKLVGGMMTLTEVNVEINILSNA